jgi:hypothetical protein
MIEDSPEVYEALFEQFKAVHPEYADEPAYSPGDDALRAFGKWAARALNAAINREQPTTRGQSRLCTGVDSSDDGQWPAFVAENPEFMDRVAGDSVEQEKADELLPVTRRLLSGGVDE